MNRYTLFADIAGRVSLETAGNPRVTAAAVAVESARVEEIRAKVLPARPKWSKCTLADAQHMTTLLARECAAISVVSVNKDTEAWRQFWEDAKPLQAAIVAQDRRIAGFAKPSNVAVFWLFGLAFALASAHAVKIGPSNRIVDYRGRELIERTILCDSDIQGEENIAVFRSLWDRHDGSQPLLDKLGIRFTTSEVRVVTDDDEPLLLLADYAAGLAHSSLITDPGRIRLPLTSDDTKPLMKVLHDSGKLALQAGNFELKYEEIFGQVMRLVSEQAAC